MRFTTGLVILTLFSATVLAQAPTSIVSAAESGSVDELRRLIKAGGDLNAQGGLWTPLGAAAFRSRAQAVGALLAAGADPNRAMSDGTTPLMLAAASGSTACVAALVRGGARVDTTHPGHGHTALHSAAGEGHKEVVSLLLARGAAIDARDRNNETPLLFAARGGFDATVKELLRAGADATLRDRYLNWPPALYALLHHHRSTFDLLLPVSGDPKALLSIALSGRAKLPAEMASILSAIGGSAETVDAQSRAPLLAAVERGDVALVRRLLQQGASPNVVGGGAMSPLMIAADRGHADIASLLLAQGAAIEARDDRKRTPLMIAAGAARSTVLARLIDARAQLDARGIQGRSALHYAAEAGDLASVQLLISAGASVHSEADSRTTLHFAMQKGDAALIDALIDRGANLNAQTRTLPSGPRDGQTALYLAASWSNEAAVAALLSRGANPNLLTGPYAVSPLMIAAAKPNPAIVRRLIAGGASVNQASNEIGASPLHLACEAGQLGNVEALLDAKPRIDARLDVRSCRANRFGLTAPAIGGDPCAAALAQYGSLDATPLMVAAYRGHRAIVAALLSRGADARLTDRAGKNARALALEQHHEDIAALLPR